MLLSVAFIKYKELIVFKNQSKKTEEQFQCAFKSFVKFMGDIEIKDITFALIRDWKQQQKTSEATSRGYIISLRQVLNMPGNKAMSVLIQRPYLYQSARTRYPTTYYPMK